MDLDNSNFLEYLRQYKPYLLDIETQVQRMQKETGFGDISVVLNMTNRVVDRGEMIVSIKKVYVRKKDNRL